jgi:hypothetical protein
MREEDSDHICRLGAEAWKRLKKNKNWDDWLKVGEAMLVGREWSMTQAGTNRPSGKGYNVVFGEWLKKYKLDDLDKSIRSRLFDVMDSREQIENWRRTLPLSERLNLNHPNAVLRKWKAFMEPEKPKSNKPSIKDSIVILEEENTALKNHVAELEAARATDISHVSMLTALLRALPIKIDDFDDNAFDPTDLIELAKNLNSIANELEARRHNNQ